MLITDSSEPYLGMITLAWWRASISNNLCPPEPVFIFVNIPITSDQSVWSQPSLLISTYQLCQHPLSFLAVTPIVTLSLNHFYLLITFRASCNIINILFVNTVLYS